MKRFLILWAAAVAAAALIALSRLVVELGRWHTVGVFEAAYAEGFNEVLNAHG